MTEQTDARELRERLRAIAEPRFSPLFPEEVATLHEAAAALERLEALEAAMADPTYDQSGEACMWFRHDFGLMNNKDREDLRWQAREWIRAWRKTLVPAPADRTGGADA